MEQPLSPPPQLVQQSFEQENKNQEANEIESPRELEVQITGSFDLEQARYQRSVTNASQHSPQNQGTAENQQQSATIATPTVVDSQDEDATFLQLPLQELEIAQSPIKPRKSVLSDSPFDTFEPHISDSEDENDASAETKHGFEVKAELKTRNANGTSEKSKATSDDDVQSHAAKDEQNSVQVFPVVADVARVQTSAPRFLEKKTTSTIPK